MVTVTADDSTALAFCAVSIQRRDSGFWGKDVVVRHLGELYQGTFVMDPDYTRLKVVGITRDVAETYVPLNISVAYAGQTGTPKPFLMIVNWVRTPAGWKMAADIALPIPAVQPR
jgi:hypothetical protein